MTIGSRGFTGSIVLPYRNHAAYTAARISDITCVARNQVQMHVRHSLSGEFANVDAQVVTGTILYDGVLPETDNHFSATTGKEGIQENLQWKVG